jgi:soluble lytic murein transglycosylase-like protein
MAWKSGVVNEYLPADFPRYISPTIKGGPEKVTPASAPNTATGKTTEENWLRQNNIHVSNFSAAHPHLTAAMMWQESRGNPDAESHAGALGLMQVMPSTAQWMHDDLDYNKFKSTRVVLKTPAGSIYFGTHYMEYLQSIRAGRSWEWLIRAYNGGPAGANRYMGGGKNTENDGYFAAVTARWNKMKQLNSVDA